MSAAVLCIGTELTRGELADTNGAWLAERLTALGFEVLEMATVADIESDIEATLHRLGERHQVVVSTGGLGPTTDDLTTACAARVLGVPLQRDAASLDTIRRFIESRGRAMASSNAKQADFPAGARILPNAHGTAPGFGVTIGRALTFFMPGVPREMMPMFDEQVAPSIVDLVSDHMHQVRLQTFGLPESVANDQLAGIEAEGLVVGYRARLPVLEVKLLGRAASAERAAEIANEAAQQVRSRLGEDVIFGEGRTSLAEAVGEKLLARGWRMAAAESCTGGMVGSLMTDVSGSSRYFLGSAVVYSNEAKARLLDVPRELLERHGAVSAEVAQAMAAQARERYGADIAISLTGVAGPDGGTETKPVGLVHFGLALADEVASVERRFVGGRERVRKLAAHTALELVRRAVSRGSLQQGLAL